MYADWQAAANARIAAIHASMPDATLEELKKALRREAGNFHGGTSWGKKTWSKRCRIYLQQRMGMKPISPRERFADRDDICFPFAKDGN